MNPNGNQDPQEVERRHKEILRQLDRSILTAKISFAVMVIVLVWLLIFLFVGIRR